MPSNLSKEALGSTSTQSLADFAKGCWVLFVYCMFSTIQCTMWATPGPISSTLLAVYPNSITSFDIQFFLNWGTIMFVPCALPFAYFMSRPHGLRRCTLAGIFLITAGAACRCGAQRDDTLSLVLWHVSSILVGAAGPAAMGAPSLLAEVWFPPAHRGIAMSLAAEANSIGGAIAFAMPPLLLPASTLVDLNHVYEVGLGLCLFCCVCALYFPDKPSAPPSRSAAVEHSASEAMTLRTMFAALWSLAKNRQFLIIIVIYAVTGGFNSAWSSTLNLNLSQVCRCECVQESFDCPYSRAPRLLLQVGIRQAMSGYIGLVSTVIGNIVGVICGAYVDRFHRMKPTLVALNAVNIAALALFAIVVQPSLSSVMHLSPGAVLGLVWVSAVTSGMALNGAIPLFFELAVENAFPVSTAFVIMGTIEDLNCGHAVLL